MGNYLKKLTKVRFIIVFLLLVSNLSLPAQTTTPPEYQIKAVFLFNFTQFIEWPAAAFPEANTPLIIGVLGENPFGTYLDQTVSGEKVNGHPLSVQYYKSIQEVKNCHILFVNFRQNDRNVQALSGLKNRNILTVSDAVNFTSKGGIVGFFNENNKIRIQINPETARDANLVISSKLLRLAKMTSN